MWWWEGRLARRRRRSRRESRGHVDVGAGAEELVGGDFRAAERGVGVCRGIGSRRGAQERRQARGRADIEEEVVGFGDATLEPVVGAEGTLVVDGERGGEVGKVKEFG